MKDNEKVILIVLGIIAAIVLPYFLYSKQAKIDTEAIKNHCAELQTEYDRLYEMDQNREFYISETERYDEEMAEIIAKFPADIDDSNTTLFLLDTEYSCPIPSKLDDLMEYSVKGYGLRSVVLDDARAGSAMYTVKDDTIVINNRQGTENGLLYRASVPIIFDTVSFGEKFEEPIAKDGVDTGMWAVTDSASVTYRTYYPGFKHLLSWFLSTEDPMTYPNWTASYDKETGTVSGSFVLTQFAVIDNNDENRVLNPRNWEVEEGWDVKVDSTVGHGNEEDGIFGPIDVYYDGDEDENIEIYIDEE